MKHLQFKNKTELGTAYYYCYGDERFEKWLKLKNIKYRYYNEGKNLFEEKDKEIERLNNIINGIEKILKECMQHYDYLYDEFEEKETLDTYYDYKYVFDKLQELKGDSSNE